MRLLSALALIAASAPAAAIAPATVVPKPASDKSAAMAGDLYVRQLATDSVDRLFKEWAQPTPPHLTTTTQTERNKPIFTFIIFGGCRRDAQGHCDVVANFEIIDPDGGSYGKQGDAPLLQGTAPEEAKMLILSQSSLGLVIEKGEKLGVYLVKVEVTDRNAKVVARTEQALTVVEAGN